MDRLKLQRVIRYEGRDFWGRRSTLVLEPFLGGEDWYWDVGTHCVPITPDLMTCRRRRVALQWSKFRLNEFEHIGILRAAGLRSVRISLMGSTWLPYDGGSFGLWQAVMPYVDRSGELKPFRLFSDSRLLTQVLPEEPSRYVQYSDTSGPILRMTGVIDFPNLGEHRFGHQYPDDDLLELVSARTLGWPPYLYGAAGLASCFGWPHADRIVWPQEAKPQAVLEETGRHRLLDMLGILNFAAPADRYLTGSLHSCRGNHATDLGLLRQIAAITNRAKILSFRPAA